MTKSSKTSLGRDRLALGYVLLVLSIVPWLVVPFTPLLGLPGSQLSGVIGVLVIGAEIAGAVAVAVLGREACVRCFRRFHCSKKTARGNAE